ncbi:MAG: hypothetical protein J5843_00530 [Clostridia bacterium]|nr:hypothetical protein [Clostridia bacterium]
MFKKMKLKKEIEDCKKRITELEQKRSRSQAALVEAILTHTEPNDKDVDFFNMFTKQIEDVRENMHAKMVELEEMEMGKKK